MSTNRTLIAQFVGLPVEVAHLICLFTGKFIFDTNGRLKSIINIDDFKNIETLMLIHDYHQNKYLFHRFNNDQKTRFIQNLYSDRLLNKKERMKEEILSLQKVDYVKQSYLFTKPSTIEEVMIPDKVQVDLSKLCDECCLGKSLSKNPEKKPEIILPIKESTGFIFGHTINFPIYYHLFHLFDNHDTHIYKKQNINTKKKMSCDTCNNCNQPLSPKKTKTIQDFDKKIQKKSVKFNGMVKEKRPAIKNFRR